MRSGVDDDSRKSAAAHNATIAYDGELTPFTYWMISGVAFYRLVAVLVLIFAGVANIEHYTYWNYTLQSVFYVLLAISLTFNLPALFHTLSVFFFPMVFGSVFLVFLFIVVVLQLDQGQLFFESTIQGGGQLDVGSVHTGDTLIHFFTVVDMFIVLLSGYFTMARLSLYMFRKLHGVNRIQRIAFRCYYYLSPIVPMLLYALFFNPFEEYPTGKSDTFIMCLALVLDLLTMAWLYEVMTRRSPLHVTSIVNQSIPSSPYIATTASYVERV